ncbi:restriction endonuclease [Streptomyces nondiastaticus]|uniref:restriction endonuclease n=1 Tax=Streptomyces nondiastaticus TaxID=3154512 RepID=UPI0034138850
MTHQRQPRLTRGPLTQWRQPLIFGVPAVKALAFTALALVGIATTVALIVACVWLSDHHWVLATASSAGLFLFACWAKGRHDIRDEWDRIRARGLRFQLRDIDALHHREFEFAIRDLMRRDGFKAEQLGGANDDACDVRGVDADGRVWALQCKHRRDGLDGAATGTPVLQQVKGTAGPVHGADFAVVVTNGRFSSKALAWGIAHDVHHVDRNKLSQWAADGRLLWEVLEKVPPPRNAPSRPRAPRSARQAGGRADTPLAMLWRAGQSKTRPRKVLHLSVRGRRSRAK